MNTSQPISSFLSSVSYNFLTSKDIRALSVKEITNTSTLDDLTNPVSGGLYSLELGQFGDNDCATCGLKTPQCPGHCGHISLPVPCYHPTFMDQILKLLRAHCFFCRRLRLSRSAVNMFICKMRLINHGLMKELVELEHVESTFIAREDVDEEDQDEDTANSVSKLQNAFVKQAIKEAEAEGRVTMQKSEASLEARRIIIQDFIASFNKTNKCANCQGFSPKLRKDGYTTIYRMPLSEKHNHANIQAGLKEKSLVLINAKRKRVNGEKSRKRMRMEDEGVADMERSADEESEELTDESDDSSGGDIAMGDEDVTDEEVAEKSAPKLPTQHTVLSTVDVLLCLNKMFALEQEAFSLLYGRERRGSSNTSHCTADMLFVHDVLVPPNRFRPETRAGSAELNEAPENSLYSNILKCVDSIRLNQRMWTEYKTGKGIKPRNPNAVAIDLQNAVNAVIDRERNSTRTDAKNKPEGVKQKLEKKEGMFRKYMMGKRVNFAARTVISPDPNIETNEIGVPPVFAIKLTYPEPVTIWNVEELQEAVKNGPRKWPGAVAIESETGQILSLERKNADERLAIANQLLASSVTTGSGAVRGSKPKKVHRHLNNGDIVIMNRQPTLHKPSMMCHRARVLPGEKTLRMHYANCNTYNADFDGDEMNMHFPQNEIARAEALSIADTDHQYLSATAGKPLRGLIQDHISICVMLTKRDTFFTRPEYMQLLYAALRPENGHCTSGRLETIPPAMFKPRKLWTGKQVITTVLRNIVPEGFEGLTMKGASQTDAVNWSENSDEAVVIFKDGHLVQGILDKKQIGPSGGGFVNGVYETYGHTVAGRLLSVLGRLLTKLLHMRAHSCGVEDLVFTTSGEQRRREALTDSETIGLTVAAQHVSLEDANVRSTDPELKRRLEEVLRDDDKQRGLDNRMKNALSGLSSSVTKACLPSALVKKFPRNQMQLMTVTGAKGSIVNANQISCNLGQQVLEGRRVPVMVSGKTLPCFKPFESSARAGGYIVDRFLTGVRPQEFYFHAMAGREGLIDTAVKTSRSGYLQRCLVKGMEGLKVQYDSSVRDADGSVVQFLYGEDGLDVAKAKYLSDMTFTAQNYLSLWKSLGIFGSLDTVVSADAAEATKKAEKKYRKRNDLSASDPAISIYNPARHGGAISEKVFAAARSYMDADPDDLIKKKSERGSSALTRHTFNTIVKLRYMRSVVEAGEAVGVVAGQSVGEPSTQMTLNTFHLAGHATKNVTLGIPRLREIVMTAAANISTPTMTLRLIEEMNEDEAKQFAKAISRLSLAEIVDKVTVDETTGQGSSYGQVKRYNVKLEFFPQSEYTKEYAITTSDVLNTIEYQFLPLLHKEFVKQENRNKDNKTKTISDAMPDVGVSAGRVQEFAANEDAEREDGADDSDVDDGDATAAKSKVNRQQEGYGAFEDDEERDIARQAQEQDDPQNREDDEAYHSQDEEEAALKKEYADQIQTRIAANTATRSIVAFSFDHDQGSYCTFTVEGEADSAKVLMLHLVEVAVRKALIQSVDGIVSAIYDSATTKETNVTHVATEGLNIKAMWQYQHIVNPHAIYTNSIHDILTIYGVEAARDAIVRELNGVFQGHSISVDARHLTLIADYMTRGGGYLPFNRNGYRSNPSPFMKMSFETTVGFLKDAVLYGDWDDLEGPSSRIVVGRLNKVGTGGFDVYTDLDKQELTEKDAVPVATADDSASEMSED